MTYWVRNLLTWGTSLEKLFMMLALFASYRKGEY